MKKNINSAKCLACGNKVTAKQTNSFRYDWVCEVCGTSGYIAVAKE